MSLRRCIFFSIMILNVGKATSVKNTRRKAFFLCTLYTHNQKHAEFGHHYFWSLCHHCVLTFVFSHPDAIYSDLLYIVLNVSLKLQLAQTRLEWLWEWYATSQKLMRNFILKKTHTKKHSLEMFHWKIKNFFFFWPRSTSMKEFFIWNQI